MNLGKVDVRIVYIIRHIRSDISCWYVLSYIVRIYCRRIYCWNREMV